MKTIIEENIKTKAIDTIVCDICKTEYHVKWSMSAIKDGKPWWLDTEDDEYKAETAIRLTKTCNYPGCMENTVEITEFDICHKCFEEKLIPWLKSLGAKPTITENEY